MFGFSFFTGCCCCFCGRRGVLCLSNSFDALNRLSINKTRVASANFFISGDGMTGLGGHGEKEDTRVELAQVRGVARGVDGE